MSRIHLAWTCGRGPDGSVTPRVGRERGGVHPQPPAGPGGPHHLPGFLRCRGVLHGGLDLVGRDPGVVAAGAGAGGERGHPIRLQPRPPAPARSGGSPGPPGTPSPVGVVAPVQQHLLVSLHHRPHPLLYKAQAEGTVLGTAPTTAPTAPGGAAPVATHCPAPSTAPPDVSPSVLSPPGSHPPSSRFPGTGQTTWDALLLSSVTVPCKEGGARG